VVHHRLSERKRLGHDPAQCLGIGPALDDEVFAVDKPVGAGGKGGFVSGMANAPVRTVSCFIVVEFQIDLR
jgi:hypothetical protein